MNSFCNVVHKKAIALVCGTEVHSILNAVAHADSRAARKIAMLPLWALKNPGTNLRKEVKIMNTETKLQ